MEDEMDTRKPHGQYRTEPSDDHEPMAYVYGGGSPSYVTEGTYRARGYLPVFERLPTEDEYDAVRS
jgi:hypothetical protein